MALSVKELSTRRVFYSFLKAGLWEQRIQLFPFGEIDFESLYHLADEQSVIGLVAAGMEQVTDTKLAKKDVVQFIGRTVHLENRNKSMNAFIGEIVEKMRGRGIYCLLVKGQGVAQCYERPLWRSSGDIDFLLSEDCLVRAFLSLSPLAQHVDREESYSKHIGMTIDPWKVELHGSLRCGLSSRMDKVIDEIQTDCFRGWSVRVWKNGETDVFLPDANSDILFIFTHFLKHFYKGGIGLRQICDWCRLLWTYRNSLDSQLLISRLREMRIVSEWKAFGAFAVEYLGMPEEAMLFYSSEKKWKRKASYIESFIMEVGNLGQNRDTSYYNKYPFVIRKTISMGRRIGDLICHVRIFPWDSLRFFPKIMFNGLRSAVKGE